jgi:hypothetical protein
MKKSIIALSIVSALSVSTPFAINSVATAKFESNLENNIVAAKKKAAFLTESVEVMDSLFENNLEKNTIAAKKKASII